MSNSDGRIGLAWDASDDAEKEEEEIDWDIMEENRRPFKPNRRLKTSLTTG